MQRFFEHFNWPLFGVTIALLVIGLINLYSAVHFWGEGVTHSYFWSQLVWTMIGLLVMFVVMASDYRIYYSVARPAYVIVCALLILSLVMGEMVRGTHGWLKLGPFSLQPAEFAKLAYILIAARFFSDHPNLDGYSLRSLWQPLLFMIIPFGLIVMQGDLGSSLFLICIFVSMSLFAKVKKGTIVLCILVALVAGGSVYTFGLKDYQRDRIATFMHPEQDLRGSGYHLMQSKIAVGSGRLFGKGYLKGNINKLRYLPERHTDFIFPVFAEEWGFVGSFVVLALYAALLLMGVR